MNIKELIVKAMKDAFNAKKQVFVSTHPHTGSIDFYSYNEGMWNDDGNNEQTFSIHINYEGELKDNLSTVENKLKSLYKWIS